MAATPPSPPDRPAENATEPAPDKAADATPPRATASPSPADGAALPLGYAGIIAVLLVVASIGAGLAIGTIARPGPTPTPAPTIAAPTRTPVPTTDPQVFRQQLSSGCATGQGIWVVSDGGALLRYDGEHWTQVDSTLRTLTHASCDEQTLYAVGPVGAVLILDDRARSISSFDVTLAHLRGISAMPQGAMASGTEGTVMLLSGGTWHQYASGIEEDLNAIVAFDLNSAWAVGSQGASYRLEPAGWRPVATGVTVTLRAVSSSGPQSALAAGDAGTLLVFDGTWTAIESGVTSNLRSIARFGTAEWIAGDAGTLLKLDAVGGDHTAPRTAPPTEVDLGTTCDLRGVFVSGQDLWVIGSTGSRAGVWRIRGDRVAERWGEC